MSSIRSKGLIEMPALGRPFRLGMLYDCRTDKLIPGITLWDEEFLQQKLVTQHQESSKVKIFAAESISDKANVLDIKAELKLSFLAGLLEVSGSAEYLDDRKSSDYKARVSMQYKCTTRFQEMTMEQLGKGRIMHPEVFDHGNATHVVTGILFGGQAFFVFEKQLSDKEENKKVIGDMHIAIKELPGIADIKGGASVDISEDLKAKTDGFQCTFYGDFIPPKNPTTYIDAVHLYKDLPELMGVQSGRSVPINVWLYPLENLDRRAAKLVREISISSLERTERTLEQLHHLQIKCNDLVNSLPCQKFPGLSQKIINFKEMLGEYRLNFQKQILPILPEIRGGGKEEVVLADILEMREASPFDQRHLGHWVEEAETLICVLETYVTCLSEIPFANSQGDLTAAILNPNSTYVACFTISIAQKEPLLMAMQAYLRDIKNSDHCYDGASVPRAPLYQSLANTMVKNARQFKEFAQENKITSKTSFIINEDRHELGEPGGLIFLYKDGHLIDNNYEPPSTPGKPMCVETTHDSLQLKWKIPECGFNKITNYEVSFKQASETENQWKSLSSHTKDPLVTASDLKAASIYLFKVRALCEVGRSKISEVNCLKTDPTSPPGKPALQLLPGVLIEVKWTCPDVCPDDVKIKCYEVQYCMIDSTSDDQNVSTDEVKWSEMQSHHNDKTATHTAINNKTYMFRVRADSGQAGKSKYSPVSDPINIRVPSDKFTKEKILRESDVVRHGCPSIYSLKLKEVVRRETEKINKYEFGKSISNIKVNEKVIMVVGATGAGKTTLINGLVNYVFGVEWDDCYRFKLIHEEFRESQASSQTTAITAYTIHHQSDFQVTFTLTIIDTPGFGDTAGIGRDKEISKQIHSFFSTKGIGGIDHIDAIGFVAQAALARLTPTQKYVFDSILSLFGKDIAENIFILVTFADGKKPPVMDGIKKAELPFKGYFKFNNSALFAQKSQDAEDGHEDDGKDRDDDDDDDDGGFDAMFWDMGAKSFKRFLDKLLNIKQQSLILTQNVLDERCRLEVYIIGIQQSIRSGLNQIEQLKKENEVLSQHQRDIDRNKNFKYTVEEQVAKTVEIPVGQYITNCVTCNVTCHFPCGIPDDDQKRNCAAMDKKNPGYCEVCPQKCHWSMHKNMRYKIEFEKRSVEKDSKDLKQRYEDAQGKKLSAQQIIMKVQEDFGDYQLKVLKLTEEIRQSLNRLQEIALLPNPLSSVEYIDILIQAAKNEAKPGWSNDVEQLQELRKHAEILKTIERKDFKPFQEWEAVEGSLPKEEGKGAINRFLKWINK